MKILFNGDLQHDKENGLQESSSKLKDLLNPLFEEAETNKIDYCVCGNYNELPDYTSHDIDIWAKDTRAFENLLLNVSKKNGFTLYLCNKSANGFNNYFYKIGADGISFVQLDLLRECAWLPFIPIVRSKRIGEGRIRYKNFWVAEPIVESVMHLLYPLLHSGRIKEKYKDKLYLHKDNKKFNRLLIEALGSETAREIVTRIGMKDWQGLERNVKRYRMRLFIHSIVMDNVKNIGRFFAFVGTNLSRFFSPAGLFIVFMGSDGCGKTTITNDLSIKLKDCFTSGKIKKFYWRPFFLPRLQALVPFKGKKEEPEIPADSGLRIVTLSFVSRLKYILKYFYYVADFIIGRVKYQSAWSRGGLVFFDRYYYDHMVYPERFGFSVPGWVMRALMVLVPEPELKFYLYAPPERLFERKQELSMEEIKRQDKEYKRIISPLDGAFILNTDKSLDETQKEITEICISYMAQRLKRRSDG